jgi:superfamily I DNA and/or RNA helicase
MNPENKITFIDFLKKGVANGGFQNEDIVAICTPLFQDVLTFHEQNKVAPLEGLHHILITNEMLDIDEKFIESPKSNNKKLATITASLSEAFTIIGEKKSITDTSKSSIDEINLDVQLDKNKEITKPVFLTGYISYEFLIDHHDALTDVFILGLIMGSVSTGLDLNLEDELNRFVRYRKGLVHIKPSIHPAIANLVIEMTELDPKKRIKDLNEVLEKLKNYREYNPENEIDLTTLEGFKNQDVSTRNKWLLSKLKSRLFDLSRRNRLLYFKSSSKFLNLTISSVPSTLNYKSIDPNSLFVWNDSLSKKIKNCEIIALSKYLKIEDNPYIPPILDAIRCQSERDINEYGFSQLRLIICSLNWYNLKEDKFEKINSPLLLVPVKLIKKKGVKDQYTLEIIGNEAEVNSVLAHCLRELYDIKLPDSIILDEFEMSNLYQNIQDQIKSSNSGVSIEFLDKPRIKIIHSLAKQTLSQFNKRLKRNKSLSHYKDVDYSYQNGNFHPLGLQIFKEKVKPSSSFLEYLVNEDIKLSSFKITSEDKEKSLYSQGEGNINPYLWEFDSCNMILGNFNYKTMSLVKDYNEVIDENIKSIVFDKLFSDNPKKITEKNEKAEDNLSEKYQIVPCDPTQTKAINMANNAESYIIQGPPGTGKSQTITNLIADYVARGKRVLFVCEKRAAIDVVFYRLKQKNIDELCCRIHDSKADKKEFIMNLKETYNEFLKNDFDFTAIQKEREKLIATIKKELKLLEMYNNTISRVYDEAGVSILKLIERLILLGKNEVKYSVEAEEMIPCYKSWIKHGELINQLSFQLKEQQQSPYLSDHPVSLINNRAISQEKPINLISQFTVQIKELFDFINNELNRNDVPPSLKEKFGIIFELINDAQIFKTLAENDNLSLSDGNSSAAKQFEKLVQDFKESQSKISEIQKKNSNWLNKFPDDELKSAYAQLIQFEASFFSILNPSYWRLKKTIKSAYDFNRHQIKPTLKNVLEDLQKEYSLISEGKSLESNAAINFKINNILITWDCIEKLRKEKVKPTLEFLASINDAKTMLNLCDLKEKVAVANDLLDKTIVGFNEMLLKDLMKDIEELKTSLKSTQVLLPLISELNKTDETFQRFIKKESLLPSQFEQIMAEKSLNNIYQSNQEFKDLEGADIFNCSVKLKEAYEKLYEINSKYIRAKIRKNFNDRIVLSSNSASGLSVREKEIKKVYSEGRKILEHEFNKTMRYRSIRELASKESGKVIQDLKPVWLMSPLSVSDTLPLNTEYFDVVIYDEASQITLEEGVPPLFRAKQTIIVGDEMQMPPTNFFNSSGPSEEDGYEEEKNDSFQIDADSLLTQGIRKLPDVMLGWHYRSKYESLISFSNAAFYNRNLLTIPDQTIEPENLTEIKANKAKDAILNSEALFNRSISFHLMEHGLYEQRSNIPEAEYIAQLVKTLILRNEKSSIGVVAFSQEQQGEIESALIRLATEDKDFETKLEEKYQRQEDGQFVGLFVKNLENVQGDERDIMIMSVCYGYDTNRRMIMNFGPINRKGGEKRLNVIFSRAKKHMAVISSIKYVDIKNEYNDGANYFRKFLQYAENISRGEVKTAKINLDGLSKNNPSENFDNVENILAGAIASEIKSLGFEIDLNVGYSYFRCSIAVRSKIEKNKYILGILVDSVEHYKNKDLLELYVLRPSILKAFNWKILQVYTKDWLHQSEGVLTQIKKALGEQINNPS